MGSNFCISFFNRYLLRNDYMLNADLDFGDRDKGEREGFPAT